jgi:hypothetical protein
MPKGLNNKFKEAYLKFSPLQIPDYKPDLPKLNIHRLSGFIKFEGSFWFSLINSQNRMQHGKTYNICIQITQKKTSLVVLTKIKYILNCGNVYSDVRYNIFNSQIISLKD